MTRTNASNSTLLSHDSLLMKTTCHPRDVHVRSTPPAVDELPVEPRAADAAVTGKNLKGGWNGLKNKEEPDPRNAANEREAAGGLPPSC